MRNKVSVIIPVYNGERYMERCARSLFNQAFSDIEYIFVDDCTQDASIDRLKETIKEYPNRAMNIKICTHEENRGVSAARNTGLSAATGEYVIHCDSDDWMDTTMISRCIVECWLWKQILYGVLPWVGGLLLMRGSC